MLPFELMHAIIAEIWLMPLTPTHRIAFMSSAPLVSKTWLAIYSRISHKHIHIPCPSYLHLYLRKHTTPFHLCQSITLATDTPALRPEPQTPNKSLIFLLFTLDILRPPNLHALSLAYATADPDEILLDLNDTFDFAPFPSQITSFELTASALPWLACRPARLGRFVWPLPSVQHLTLRGTTEFAIADLVSACAHLATLGIDSSSSAAAVSLLDSRGDRPLAFHEGGGGASNFPATHLSIKLHSSGDDGEYWDGVETTRGGGMSVFHRCKITEAESLLTFALL